MSWELKYPRQCVTCPWRVDSHTDNIPNYERELHEKLDNTIASQDVFAQLSDRSCEKRVMACHYQQHGEQRYCIGWLMNQIGPGNNIGMRLRMLDCQNSDEIELRGEQHENFEDTFD